MAEIDYSEFMNCIKSMSESAGYVKEIYMNKARKIHRAMSLEELENMGSIVADLTPADIRNMFGVGIRSPARMIIMEELAKLREDKL